MKPDEDVRRRRRGVAAERKVKPTVVVNRFRVGTSGLLDHIEKVERAVHTSSFYGPEMVGCSQLPIRRQHYQWIVYHGKRYHVTNNENGQYELNLPQSGLCIAAWAG